jgi:hypothetical protein
MDQDETPQGPMTDLTIGPMPAPEIKYNEIDGSFWMSWNYGSTRVDVHLKDRDALRDMIRAAIEAADESERETAGTETT